MTQADFLLSAVLVKLFADRQVTVAANLIPYLVSRMPRNPRQLAGEVPQAHFVTSQGISSLTQADFLNSGRRSSFPEGAFQPRAKLAGLQLAGAGRGVEPRSALAGTAAIPVHLCHQP
jgi:hypothetical protein